MKLFKEKDIKFYFKDLHEIIEIDIEKIKEDDFMKYDSKDLIMSIVASSTLSHLNFDLTNRTSKTEMVKILGEHHPSGKHFDVMNGVKYTRARVDYYYNLPQPALLLNYEPTGYRFNNPIDASIADDKLVIHYQTWHGKENLPEDVKNKVKNAVSEFQSDITHSVNFINKDIDKFNSELETVITQIINSRREKIIKRKQQDDDLNNF